jgi:carboxylate-amine ligase
LLAFTVSKKLTLGIELEIQIVNKKGCDLVGLAGNLIKQLDIHTYSTNIKPEITQSMLEINSTIHNKPQTLLSELREIRDYLIHQVQDLNIYLTGGGTHPFQMWNERKIYPTPRFKNAANKYGYLAKMFTVFGLHIHIGCSNGDDAIYLTHALKNYVPQFIALSASSPFCQNVDTEFDSSRANVVNSFPLSGIVPPVSNWNEFSTYLEKMYELEIAGSINNFYWDIRPKPEFGTVEVRVCDSPLSIERAVMLAAYIQTIAHYLFTERPPHLLDDDKYQLYKYNRFHASRYGFAGTNINPQTHQHQTIGDNILETCRRIENYSADLGNDDFISELIELTIRKQNDAKWLRDLRLEGLTLQEIVRRQSLLWAGSHTKTENILA